jgi:hypothetical protein
MTPVGIGGPVLRVPRASFSGMRDHQRPQQQQQQQHHPSFSPHWPPRNSNGSGSASASASAARRGSVGGVGSYGYGYGAGRFSIGGGNGSGSSISQQYDRFNSRDEQDLEVQEDEAESGESYERRSQEFEAAKVS